MDNIWGDVEFMWPLRIHTWTWVTRSDIMINDKVVRGSHPKLIDNGWSGPNPYKPHARSYFPDVGFIYQQKENKM